MSDRIVVLLVARVPAGGVDAYLRYERAVLPLLAEHGGALTRRLRSDDGCVEAHVVEFPSAGSLAAYRADPRRARHSALYEASGAQAEVLELREAPIDELV